LEAGITTVDAFTKKGPFSLERLFVDIDEPGTGATIIAWPTFHLE